MADGPLEGTNLDDRPPMGDAASDMTNAVILQTVLDLQAKVARMAQKIERLETLYQERNR